MFFLYVFFPPFSHYICNSCKFHTPHGVHAHATNIWNNFDIKNRTNICSTLVLKQAPVNHFFAKCYIFQLNRSARKTHALFKRIAAKFQPQFSLQYVFAMKIILYSSLISKKIMHCPVGTNILEKAWMLPKMQKMQHFKKYCNLQHVFPKTICSFNLKQPFWKGLRFLKWMLQYFKEYHNFWWKMFVKRNAATVQGVLCVVMNIFFKKMFQKGMQFPTEPAILKRAYIFQMEFNEYEKKFPQKKSFLWNMSSRICYVRLWDILHTPFVFFQIWKMSYFCPCSM